MTEQTIEEAKAALRLKAHDKRRQLSGDRRIEASKAAAAHFFNDVALDPASTVAAYWPIRDELDCRPILVRLMDQGQRVCLPVVLGDDQPLLLRLWEVGAPLYPAGFGTLAPPEDAPAVEPDVVLMPLLGFDREGTRLGYGGGYYDRTLAALSRRPRLIGLAFAFQEIDRIPRESHDIPLDAILTETGVRHFSQATVS